MEDDKSLAPFKGLSGHLVSKDPKTFEIILGAVVDHFSLDTPFEHAIANRVAASWMMLQHSEQLLMEHGLIYMVHQEGVEKPIPKVSEIAYFKNQLEKEFRSYFNMLSRAKQVVVGGGKKEVIDLSAVIGAAIDKEKTTNRYKKNKK